MHVRRLCVLALLIRAGWGHHLPAQGKAVGGELAWTLVATVPDSAIGFEMVTSARIRVLDDGSLILFPSSGTFSTYRAPRLGAPFRPFTRRGFGPGEVAFAVDVASTPKGIAILDGAASRVSVLSVAGEKAVFRGVYRSPLGKGHVGSCGDTIVSDGQTSDRTVRRFGLFRMRAGDAPTMLAALDSTVRPVEGAVGVGAVELHRLANFAMRRSIDGPTLVAGVFRMALAELDASCQLSSWRELPSRWFPDALRRYQQGIRPGLVAAERLDDGRLLTLGARQRESRGAGQAPVAIGNYADGRKWVEYVVELFDPTLTRSLSVVLVPDGVPVLAGGGLLSVYSEQDAGRFIRLYRLSPNGRLR
jgi:hypothetical protein